MDPVQPAPQPQSQPAQQPVMDVMPPRPAEPVKMPPREDGPAPMPQPATKLDEKKADGKQAPPKMAKPKQAGTGFAITATIVIVLGLAAMMVYAYLRTNGF